MLKGHTTFELTDVKTGEVERIEENNMFTNALNEVFNRSPFYFNNLLLATHFQVNNQESIITPTFEKALGGLLLFPEKIAEDASNIYAPTDNKPVGIASNDGYSGTDQRRGSFNAIESGAIMDGDKPVGYRFVWDFTTSQANGAISCACLTSWKGGAGYLDGSDTLLHNTAYSSPYNIGGILHAKLTNGSQQDTDDYPRGFAFGADETGVYFYRPSNDTVYKYEVPQNKLDLFANNDEYKVLFKVQRTGTLCKVPGGVAVVTVGSTTKTALTIDTYSELDNWARTTNSYVVNTNLGVTNEQHSAAYVGGYLYLRGDANGTIVKVNLDNLADVTTFTDLPNVYRLGSFGDACASSEFIIESDGTVHLGSLVSTPIYKSGAWAILSNGGTITTVNQMVVGATIFTPYLATINNLRNAVTKTADKTMKVIYTVNVVD